MLAMFDTRQELPLCGTVTFQLIRDKDPRDVGEPLEQLAEEPLGGSRVPVTLDQYVKGVAILVQGPPQIVALTVNAQQHVIQMPRVTRPGASTP
jgi:hypothetical protein